MTMPSFEEFEYEDTLEPEIVLRSIVGLLRDRANSTEGWLSLINHPENLVTTDEIKEQCLTNTKTMKLILEKAKRYVDKRESNT